MPRASTMRTTGKRCAPSCWMRSPNGDQLGWTAWPKRRHVFTVSSVRAGKSRTGFLLQSPGTAGRPRKRRACSFGRECRPIGMGCLPTPGRRRNPRPERDTDGGIGCSRPEMRVHSPRSGRRAAGDERCLRPAETSRGIPEQVSGGSWACLTVFRHHSLTVCRPRARTRRRQRRRRCITPPAIDVDDACASARTAPAALRGRTAMGCRRSLPIGGDPGTRNWTHCGQVKLSRSPSQAPRSSASRRPLRVR